MIFHVRYHDELEEVKMSKIRQTQNFDKYINIVICKFAINQNYFVNLNTVNLYL